MVMHSIFRHVLRSPFKAVIAPPIGGGAVSLDAAIRARFENGEQGAWYDPSDMSTMFQDSAGSTPVTAVGQPVGKILDKSGRGNHASQSTAASRPVLSARKNLLTYSEQFDNAAWAKANTTVTANAAVAPDGTTTADKITPKATEASKAVYYALAATAPVTFSLYAKAAEYGWLFIDLGSSTLRAYFDLTNGALGDVPAGCTATITAVGSGWYRCTVTHPSSYSGYAEISTGPTNLFGVSYLPSGTSGAYIWGAQVENGSEATAYQRVNTATNYDTVGFPHFIRFDGVDDKLTTTFPNLGSNVTIARSIPGTGASILTGQTIGAGTFGISDDACALIIIDRALTGPETTLVTDYLNARAGL